MVVIEVSRLSKIAREVGERLRLFRQQLGISQEQLAFKAGITPSYLGQVERGEKSPTIDSLEKVAKALNISLEQVFSKRSEDITELGIMDRIAFELRGRTLAEQEAIYSLMKQVLKFKDGN